MRFPVILEIRVENVAVQYAGGAQVEVTGHQKSPYVCRLGGLVFGRLSQLDVAWNSGGFQCVAGVGQLWGWRPAGEIDL